MKTRLVAGPGFAALLENGRLVDYRLDGVDPAGFVTTATVDRIHGGLNAAFIRMADGAIGLLSGSDARDAAGRRPERVGQGIAQGQLLVLQIQSAAHDDFNEDKGPSLTQEVNLTGRFLVHRPMGSEIQLSRRLKRSGFSLPPILKDLLSAGGWTVRQAAADAAPDALAADAERLRLQGLQILAANRQPPPAGAEILAPSGAAERLAVTLPAKTRLDLAGDIDRLRAALAPWPDLANAPDSGDPLAMEAVAEGLAEAREERIALPSGGNIIIQPTAALTAIDVNGGETGKGEAMAVNLEAAQQVARQLRLRNIGGPVMIDMLRLHRPVDRERLINALSGAALRDPLGIDIYGFTGLGLLELARPRRGLRLADALAMKSE